MLKALFKLKDDELAFTHAIDVTQEIVEAVRVAKETILHCGHNPKPVFRVDQPKFKVKSPKAPIAKVKDTTNETEPGIFQRILGKMWKEGSHWRGLSTHK